MPFCVARSRATPARATAQLAAASRPGTVSHRRASELTDRRPPSAALGHNMPIAVVPGPHLRYRFANSPQLCVLTGHTLLMMGSDPGAVASRLAFGVGSEPAALRAVRQPGRGGGGRPYVEAVACDDKRMKKVEDTEDIRREAHRHPQESCREESARKARLAHLRTRIVVVPSSEMSPSLVACCHPLLPTSQSALTQFPPFPGGT